MRFLYSTPAATVVSRHHYLKVHAYTKRNEAPSITAVTVVTSARTAVRLVAMPFLPKELYNGHQRMEYRNYSSTISTVTIKYAINFLVDYVWESSLSSPGSWAGGGGGGATVYCTWLSDYKANSMGRLRNFAWRQKLWKRWFK